MKGKVFILIALALFGYTKLNAQELKAKATINSSKIQGTNKSVFNTLESSINEFLNATKWANSIYSDLEKIECSFYIILTEVNGNKYSGSVQVQAKRPVYNTSYQTVTLNFMDEDFSFDYIEFDKLEFEQRTFRSNLTSILAYYAYIILGVDGDSFAFKGGDAFFDRAREVVTNAQKESYSGWNPYEGSSRRNRYWFIETILNNKYSPVRNAYYKFHRLGLDLLESDAEKGREGITLAIHDLQKVYRDKPDPYLLFNRTFFDAKADEIVNIFLVAPNKERLEIYYVLNDIDNGNSKKYEKLKPKAGL